MHRFAGKVAADPSYITDIDGYVIVKDPYVYGANGISSAWNMLSRSDGNRAYAQAGYLRNGNGGSLLYYTETGCNTCGFSRTTYGSATPGTNARFATYYRVSSGHPLARFAINGVFRNDADWPGGTANAPWIADSFGEIYNNKSQMPGVPSGHEAFSGIWIADSAGAHPMNGAAQNDNSSWFGETVYDGANHDIWEKRC